MTASNTPPVPELPSSQVPLAKSEIDKIHAVLQSIMDLVWPLHQLLAAVEGKDDGMTGRLEEILNALARIAGTMQAATKALTRLVETNGLALTAPETLSSIAAQQLEQGRDITEIRDRLNLLIDWLGAQLPPEAV